MTMLIIGCLVAALCASVAYASDPCLPNHCLGYSRCEPADPQASTPYHCICQPGWTGDECDEPAPMCPPGEKQKCGIHTCQSEDLVCMQTMSPKVLAPRCGRRDACNGFAYSQEALGGWYLAPGCETGLGICNMCIVYGEYGQCVASSNGNPNGGD